MLMNKKNLKNLVYSFIGQLAVLGLALVVPRFILTGYGSDTNGLLSTVGQIIAYLSLLEAGIGQATRNELYKYLHGDVSDKNGISSVMSISRKTYRKMTVVYALLVAVLALVLPFAIKTDLSKPTVFFVILIEGASSVVSFFFVQDQISLLIADGRQYVNSNIEILFKSLIYIIKIVMAVLGVNIILMEAGFFVATVIKILIYKAYMKRHYGWLDYSPADNKGRLKDRGAYIITEVAWTVFSSTDMIVISIFCSTKSSSVYAVYYMVFLVISKLADAVFTSLKFNLGQTFHDDHERYKTTHDLFNTAFFGVVSALLAVAYYLCVPFVTLYTVGISDAEYIDNALPLGFCLIILLSWSRMVPEHLVGVAGLAKKLCVVSVVEVAANIILSVVLVNSLGIRGVLYATAAALPLKVIYCNYLADKVILKRSVFKTVRIIAANAVLFAALAVCRRFVGVNIGSYGSFVIHGLLFTLCFAVLFFAVNLAANPGLFKSIGKQGGK